MSLSSEVSRVAQEQFGIASLRPYQRLVVVDLLEHIQRPGDHHGALVILPTGFGKTLCFSIPIVFSPQKVLIVYPLLSLMNDQLRRFQAEHIRCASIRGGQTRTQREKMWNILDDGLASVVVTNAESLERKDVLHHLARYRYSMVVVDEAHIVSQWGRTFRPSYRNLGLFLSFLDVKLIAAFTATASDAIVSDLENSLFLGKLPHVIKASSDRDNITYHVERTLVKRHAITAILADPHRRPAVVFCPTRRSCEAYAFSHAFSAPTVPVRYYHAGLGRKERRTLEQWFFGQNNAVLFSTCAFGMGVDKKNIRTIIHVSLPSNVESYLQESGRAGRDGLSAKAFVLFGSEDFLRRTPLFTAFANTGTCIRSALLSLMGEDTDGCGGCDVCDKRLFPLRDGEREIITAVKEAPWCYAPKTLARNLCDAGGPLSSWDAEDIAQAIDTLTEEGALHAVFHRLIPGWHVLRSLRRRAKVWS
ncbi:MAG: RecQ family ATP-dependent DNA helicase [Sphaerochaetaceae bacterium]